MHGSNEVWMFQRCLCSLRPYLINKRIDDAEAAFEKAQSSIYDVAAQASPKIESKILHSKVIPTNKEEVQHRSKANNDAKYATSEIRPKKDASSSPQLDSEITTSAIAPKPKNPQPHQFDDQTDPAIKKAKDTITAKMGNPTSVEFVEIKRAGSTNTVGNSSDIVCGFVREKNGGPKPFLYLIPKNEAYIGGYNIATSAYRHICSITL
jgi:hypothetical protein